MLMYTELFPFYVHLYRVVSLYVHLYRVISLLYSLIQGCFTFVFMYTELFPFYVHFNRFCVSALVIVIAMKVIELWFREKTVNGVENCVALCGHVFFLVRHMPMILNVCVSFCGFMLC